MDFFKKITAFLGGIQAKKYFLFVFIAILLLFLAVFWVFFDSGKNNSLSKKDNAAEENFSQKTNFSNGKSQEMNIFSPSPSVLWQNTPLPRAASGTDVEGIVFEDAGLPDFAGDWMNKIAEAQKSAENNTENNFIDRQTPLPSVFLFPSASLAPRKLSDEEYFIKFYGEKMISDLNYVQNFLISRGYLNSDKRVDLKTENDLYRYLNIQVDYMESKNYINADQAKSLRNGFNLVLPELHKMERPFMEKRILDGLGIKFTIIRFLAGFITNVYAQGEVVGIDCYRQMASANPGGFNGGSTCCNCGFHCNNSGCNYFYNCGPGGAFCNVHLGCLNLICRGRPAIWDTMTGICGCG